MTSIRVLTVSGAPYEPGYAHGKAHTQAIGELTGQITVDVLMALTRYHEGNGLSVCAHAQPGYDVESSGACIMSPTTREL